MFLANYKKDGQRIQFGAQSTSAAAGLWKSYPDTAKHITVQPAFSSLTPDGRGGHRLAPFPSPLWSTVWHTLQLLPWGVQPVPRPSR